MGLYEIMFIIRPELEAEEHEEVLKELESTISGNGGTTDKLVDWRKRRLAYEINKGTEGHYYLLYFKGHGTIIPEIEHFFKVNDAVIRFLIASVEDDYYESATVEEPAAESEPVDSSAAEEADELPQANEEDKKDPVSETSEEASASSE